jgi:hypothetical protein
METCPDEIVEKILLMLDGYDVKQMSLVSKRFDLVVGNSIKLLTKYNFTLQSDKNTRDIINYEKSPRKYSTVVIQKGCSDTIEEDLKIINFIKKFLKLVVLKDCRYKANDYLSILGVISSTVRELKYVDCGIDDSQESVETLEQKPLLDKLKLLRLYDTSLDLGKIATYKDLTELDVSVDDRIFFDIVYDERAIRVSRKTDPGDLPQLLTLLPNLTKLRFNMRFTYTESDFDDRSSYLSPLDSRSAQIQELPKLEHLELSKLRHPYKPTPLNFIKNFASTLKTLVISKSIDSFPLSKFMEILGSLPVLEKLFLDLYNDEEVATITHDNLKELDVYFVDSNDVEFIGQVLSAVPNIRVLKSNIPEEILATFIEEGKLKMLKSREKCSRANDTFLGGWTPFDPFEENDFDQFGKFTNSVIKIFCCRDQLTYRFPIIKL